MSEQRELRPESSSMERDVVPASSTQTADVLAEALKAHYEALLAQDQAGQIWDRTIALVEQTLMKRALESVGGVQLKAASLLGIHRNTLRIKVANYKLTDPSADESPNSAE